MIKVMCALYSILFLYAFQTNAFHNQATIDINLYNVGKIKYYPPIGTFGNNEIAKFVESDKHGKIAVVLDISMPVLVRFIYGNSTIWLLIEPADKIVINWVTPQVANQFLISGNNGLGHQFYNQNYNLSPSDKFIGLRKLFLSESYIDANSFFDKIRNEFQHQTMWLDSLYMVNSITKGYFELMHKEIYSSLSWEAGNLIEKHLQSQPETQRILMEMLFQLNPVDSLLMSCGMGHAYYDTYYKQLFNWNKTLMDSSMVLIDELRYLTVAPIDTQKYLWGRSIVNYYVLAPSNYDYCSIYERYKYIFQEGGYIDQIRQLNLCK